MYAITYNNAAFGKTNKTLKNTLPRIRMTITLRVLCSRRWGMMKEEKINIKCMMNSCMGI